MHRADGPATSVGVDEQHLPTSLGQLGSEGHGDRAAPGRPARPPHDEQPPVLGHRGGHRSRDRGRLARLRAAQGPHPGRDVGRGLGGRRDVRGAEREGGRGVGVAARHGQHGDAEPAEPGDDVGVEAGQIGVHDSHAHRAGRADRQEVGHVHAAPHEVQPGALALQHRQQRHLPRCPT
jgi:hypothetical protein